MNQHPSIIRCAGRRCDHGVLYRDGSREWGVVYRRACDPAASGTPISVGARGGRGWRTALRTVVLVMPVLLAVALELARG